MAFWCIYCFILCLHLAFDGRNMFNLFKIRFNLRCVFCRNNLLCSTASTFTKFVDHTGLTTIGRTHLDEWSALRIFLNMTKLTTEKRPCPRWYSNPQSKQVSSSKYTPCFVLPLCLAKFCFILFTVTLSITQLNHFILALRAGSKSRGNSLQENEITF